MASRIASCSTTPSRFSGPIIFSDSGVYLHRKFYSVHRPPIRICLSRRLSGFRKEGLILDRDTRNCSSSRSGIATGGFIDDDDEDDDDEEEEDRSLDLLIRFVQNVFRKISKKARKAVRSVLPVPISSHLVRFSVNGVIILTFLWVLKAFLEVICTLGSVIFVSILLVRGIWTGITYLQEQRNHRIDELDDEHRTWRGSQLAA